MNIFQCENILIIFVFGGEFEKIIEDASLKVDVIVHFFCKD